MSQQPLNRHEHRHPEATKARTYLRQPYVGVNLALLQSGLIQPVHAGTLCVLHDDWCPMAKGGTNCECRPDDVLIRPDGTHCKIVMPNGNSGMAMKAQRNVFDAQTKQAVCMDRRADSHGAPDPSW